MFAGSTLMSGLDRLSIRSVLTGNTGSILGVVGSVALIVLCFIFFLGPTIAYFEGDYIQSTFRTLKQPTLQRYTGCDFKMAISFHSKVTGRPVNHQYISNIVDSKVVYDSPDGSFYKADVLPCNPQYFSQMDDPPHQFKSNECFIVPDLLGFLSEPNSNGYTSLFGFSFRPYCPNPFTCTYGSPYMTESDAEMLSFFEQHYYVLYFTSNIINQYGKPELRWNRIFSTQWSGRQTIIPVISAIEEIQKMYMDDSIMPWINNETISHVVWYGIIGGLHMNEDQTQNSGTATVLGTSNRNNISFRTYKKLDWLLGMLGGGFFLLYLFFWVPCNYINTTKQKIETCKAMMLTYEVGPPDIESIKSVSISYLYYLIDWIPFSLPVFKREKKLIKESEHLLDIVDLVKKQKVAMRNLKFTAKLQQFQPKRLVDFDIQQQQAHEQQYNSKFELPQDQIEIIQNERAVPLVYETNQSMLMLNNTEAGNYAISNNQPYEKISKKKIRKFKPQGKCDKILNFLSKILLQFDVFAAKPNLTANGASSFLGCLLTILIIILAVLTFALTLGNMGTTKLYMDKIYQSAEDVEVSMVTGEDFKMAICFPGVAFQDNIIVGEERIADVKFYQYSRDGTESTITEFRAVWIRDLNYPYFDFNSVTYDYVQMRYCFRPDDGVNLTVVGSDKTEKQMYFGAMVKPICTGDAAYCLENLETTKQNFFNLLNTYPMYMILPQNKYFPEDQRIFSNPVPIFLSEPTYIYNLDYTESLEETISMDFLQLVNDTGSWIVGDSPAPYEETLTTSFEDLDVNSESIPLNGPTDLPYYKIRVMPTGSAQRIIFTNYKIDFLFATIGGCFIFFFLIFSCFGRAFNEYLYKAKLADVLYDEDNENESFGTYIKRYLNLPCCKDEVIQKIETDLDTIRLAQKVDNCYHLSTVGYSSLVEKNLSLVFLKERIKEDDLVILKEEEEEEEQDDQDDFQIEWQAYKTKEKQKLKRKTANSSSVMNASDEIMENQATMQKIMMAKEERMENQQIVEEFPPERNRGTLNKLIKTFDLFKNSPGLTLDGKRSVRSHCGGICCILLLIFIIILTQHFMTVYFSNFHFVSNERMLEDNEDDLAINLDVSKNFKFMVSFIKADDFHFLDVSNITDEVSLKLVKMKTVKGRIDGPQTEEKSYNMIHCPSDYLDGFVSEFEDGNFYRDISNAYCIPENLQLTIKGNPLSETREYFKFVIHNKYESDSTFGNQKLDELLGSYIPRFHVSRPLEDYNSGNISYHMETFVKSFVYQSETSRYFNVSLIKTEIRYDTAVNPGNELPTTKTYSLTSTPEQGFQDIIVANIDRQFELSFTTADYINVHTVKKIKVNELFGIIGGAILFVFFGLGYFPRSFNQFRMRFIIGSRLYLIMGKKRTSRRKKHKGKNITIKDEEDDVATKYLSEIQLLGAWFLSFWGFITGNYNGRKNIRMISLIQSRVANDISLIEFYKKLQMCELSYLRMKLLGQHNKINLANVYAKKIEPFEEEKLKAKKIDEELVEASKVNRLSDWDLNVIMEARKSTENGNKIRIMFFEKWLDRYFGIVRSGTSRGSSVYSGSSYQPSVHWASAGLRSGMKKERSESQSLSHQDSHSRVNEAIAEVDEDRYEIE